ncbi:MAG: hypothetical protein EBQ92_09605 [Proteobacteria bacterium]|nr:hypothetical protein [Pseudomonadota bacterium]
MRFGFKKSQTAFQTGWKNLVAIGKEGSRQHFQVLIQKEVNLAIEKYCHSELKKEVGGVLVGREKGNEAIEILGAVEAKYAEHQAASLTFTHQSWDYIHQVMESKYSGLKIVGWFHTHPGYGIFLSSYDIFIHENFFSLPYQVALVIDPCQEQRGIFAWKNKKIEKLSHYWTGGTTEKVEPIELDAEEFKV